MIRQLYLALVLTLLAVFPVQSEEAGDPIWIDVRTSLEHKADHIEGDMRISGSEIVEEVAVLYPDKSTPIRLYCRSGGRSGNAAEALVAAGYTNVKNAGGIEDAREQRGLTD